MEWEKKPTQDSEKDDKIHFGVKAGSPTSTLFNFLGSDFQIQECVRGDIFFLLLLPFCPKMSSPRLEEGASAREGARGAVPHLSQPSRAVLRH